MRGDYGLFKGLRKQESCYHWRPVGYASMPYSPFGRLFGGWLYNLPGVLATSNGRVKPVQVAAQQEESAYNSTG